MNLSRAGCPCVRMDATVSMDAERQIATTSNSGIAKMEKGAKQVGKRDLRGGEGGDHEHSQGGKRDLRGGGDHEHSQGKGSAL